ncbi:hypothetical protein V2I01_36200 [Micromonospora sp. BRA006-A]|nr:hypothetical protein [Micromonospora sp. BRA006-A]
MAHLVHISVTGGPGAAGLDPVQARRRTRGGGLRRPWTVLRAAQVHDLVLTMLTAMTRLPVVPVPGGLRLQPVDAAEVAARLTELTLGAPAGLVPIWPGRTRTASRTAARLPDRHRKRRAAAGTHPGGPAARTGTARTSPGPVRRGRADLE